MTALYTDIELPLVPVLAEMERAGVRIDATGWPRSPRSCATRSTSSSSEVYELAGGAVPHRLAQAARRGAVREARAAGRPQDQDRLLDRRAACWRSSRRSTRSSHDGRGWREQSKLQEHLRRGAARARRAARRPHPHHLQPDGGGHRPALARSSPTSRTSRSAPPQGREIREAFVAAPGCLLLSADYSQVELRILAHLSGEPSACSRPSARRGHPPRAPRPRSSGKPPRSVTRDRARPRQGGQLRDHLRLSAFGLAKQLAIARAEAQANIDAYFARFPRVRGFIDETIERPRAGGLRHHAARPPPAMPDLRAQLAGRAARRAHGREHGHPGHRGRPDQAGDDRCDAALRGAGHAARLILQVHDELVFEAAGGGGRRIFAALVHEEMVSRLPARPAAGGRHRHRRHLAGREVSDWLRLSGRPLRATRATWGGAGQLPVAGGGRAARGGCRRAVPARRQLRSAGQRDGRRHRHRAHPRRAAHGGRAAAVRPGG